MQDEGVAVYRVPHTSGFNRCLERLEARKETLGAAVIGMLNAVPGGYDLRSCGISATCAS